MRKHLPLISIICLAILLRFYKLGIIPFGYTWDEVAIIYNAWGIALWHRDEWANFLPLAFKSFGDYKAPLLIYALSIPYKLIGVQEVLIRIYSAVAGVITVIATYVLAKDILKDSIPQQYLHLAQLIAAGLLAVSPWAIQFSRVGFEPNIALMFCTLGFVFLLKGETKPRLWFIAAVSFALSLYSYQNSKIFVPLMAIAYTGIKWKTILQHKKYTLAVLIAFVLFSVPMIHSTIYSGAGERGKQTLIFYAATGEMSAPATIVTEFIHNYAQQLSPQFWVHGYDFASLRHLVPGHGALHVVTAVYLLIGLCVLVLKRRPNHWLLLVWFFIGLLPATLAHGTPHAIRSLLVIPSVQIIATLGCISTYLFVKQKSRQASGVLVVISILALSVNTYSYLREYYGAYAIQSAPDFSYGYQQAIEYARYNAKDKQTIHLTDAYGQPYIYALLYNRYTPQEFTFGALARYFIAPISWPQDKPDSLFIGTPKEIPVDDPAVVEVITIPNTDIPVFVIAETP